MAENVFEFFVLPLETPENTKNAMFSHWKTAVNNGIRSVCHVLAVFFPCILHVLAVRQRSG